TVDGVVDGAVAVGVERPLDGVGHEIGGAGDVAEHLQGVELGVGRHPGRGLVGAEAGGRGRHVGAVAVDVEGVVVGLRGVEVRVGGVVVGAGEVVAVDHFVVGEAVAVHELVGVVGGVVVGLAASAHGQMRVVDARVDDGDRGPFAGQAQGVVFGGSGAGADPGDAGLVQQVVAGDGRHRLHALGGADGRDVAGAHDGADAVGADHHAGPLLDDEVADLGEDLTL